MPVSLEGETIRADGCTISVRRVDGAAARECFFACTPLVEGHGAPLDPEGQAEAVYRALAEVLEAEGGSLASLLRETVHVRSAERDLPSIRNARSRAFQSSGGESVSAVVEVEQPPLAPGASFELAAQAVLPRAGALERAALVAPGDLEGSGSRGLRVRVGADTRLHAGAIVGHGASVREQALAMFAAARELLEAHGMEFQDVVRTWIYLRDIDRDYDALNRARRAFFEANAVDPIPASTGIGGGPAELAHDVCMGFTALSGPGSAARTPMHTPTLNEAPTYGADFARGMRVAEANGTFLYVSGTASIDELGHTAHPGDFDAQADRMLLNIAALLEGQGASFGDVVSATTYLKRAADAERLREKLDAAGFTGFPQISVVAGVCRPELLCETEVFAVSPEA